MRFLALLLLLVAVASGRAEAAETLDAAVNNIAQRFAAARTGSDAPIRVAVTAFIQSDRQTTLFTNLMMIALTGKMVEHGSGVFRVIERAQLETALAEIELSDVPIFDRSTAQELGKFLGVDALVVGEVTPVYDFVRIDARLIAVETIETLEQATETVPLVPSVQRQLETAVVLSRPRVSSGSGPDLRNGVWHGQGQCGETTFGVAVSIIVNPDDTVTAMQTYYPLSSSSARMESGVLAMEGQIDAGSGEISLSPGSWLFQPAGHMALGFTGRIDVATGTLRGTYNEDGCDSIVLRRMS